MRISRRKPIRLKGFDYSKPGKYFVTICTQGRACIFGEIINGAMRLSDIGRIVDECWRQIPEHFPHTRVSIYQIMPNHAHGIVEIRERLPDAPGPICIESRRDLINETTVEVEYIQPLRGQHRYQHIIPKSLGSIIRSFKAAVTREVRRRNRQKYVPMWQRNYYDHIIRSDIDHFHVERYISLNPLLWHLDLDKPDVREFPIDDFKRTLKEQHGLDESAIRYLVDREVEYKQWQQKDSAVAKYALEGLPNNVLAAEYKLALPDEEQLAREIEDTRKRFLARRIT